MIFDRYRAHLEAELVKQELLLKFVINDKDKTIHRLEEEVKWLRSRVSILETPRPITTGKKLETKRVEPEGETSWMAYLNRHMKEMEEAEKKAKEQSHGVSRQAGQGIHEQTSGVTKRPDAGHQQVPAAEVGQATGQN